jgi:hypothetical protein
LSCLVLSCLVLSCLVLSCLVLSCLVLSCLCLVLGRDVSCRVLSCIMLSFVFLSCVTLRGVVLSCYVLCRAAVCCVCLANSTRGRESMKKDNGNLPLWSVIVSVVVFASFVVVVVDLFCFLLPLL